MTTKARSTEIVKSVSEQAKAKQQMINKRLQELKNISDSNYVTSGIFESKDIKSIRDIGQLLLIASKAMLMREAYDATAEELKIENYPPLKINGYSAEEWVKDIKLRIDIIQQHDRKKELEKMKEQLDNYITEEQKAEDLFARIEEII